jgi:hypothetical protein
LIQAKWQPIVCHPWTLDSCLAILPGTLRASANPLPADLSGIPAGMTGLWAKMRIAAPNRHHAVFRILKKMPKTQKTALYVAPLRRCVRLAFFSGVVEKMATCHFCYCYQAAC